MENPSDVGRPHIQQGVKSILDCPTDDATLRAPGPVFLITNDVAVILREHRMAFAECFEQI
jgi:hypothetical protein